MRKKSTLAAELSEYLNKHRNDKNFWSETEVGKVLEKFLIYRGNFKRSPRGNPRKGFQQQQKNKNMENYEEE